MPKGSFAECGLAAVGRKFHELKRKLELVRAGRIAGAPGAGALVPFPGPDLRDDDRLHDELFALATKSLELEAGSLEELKVLAELLLEYADPDANDIVSGLAKKLSRSVLLLSSGSTRLEP